MCLSSLSRVLSNLRCPLQGSAQATPPWGFCSLPPTLHPLHTPLDPLAQPKPSGDLELLEGKDCAFFISNPIICTWEGFIQCSSNSYLVEWNGYLLPSLWVLVVVMGGGTWFWWRHPGILHGKMFIFLQVTRRNFHCLIELFSHVKVSSELNREILSHLTVEGGRYNRRADACLKAGRLDF